MVEFTKASAYPIGLWSQDQRTRGFEYDEEAQLGYNNML
jgi:hypothetical protein